MRFSLPVTVLAAVLLASCAGTPPRPPAADPELRWLDRRQALQQLQAWQLSGRISVTDGTENWHARMNWAQFPRGYEIRLRGPLGRGELRLIGAPEGVMLDAGRDRLEYAADPETLLYAHTGTHMPVEALRWWIRGIPVPQRDGRTQLDPYGRLARLIDAGWDVEYKDYVQVAGLDLPRRLFIHKGDIEVRVVVDEWRLPEPESAHAELLPP